MWREEWMKIYQKRIQKWIDRIPRYIKKILSPEVNGSNNYKERKQDFDIRYDLWRDHRCKGNLSIHIDIATDPLSTEYTDSGEWEIYILDNEKDKDVELQVADIITSDKATRRRRPSNQTEKTKRPGIRNRSF
jgi:hypothetical protein